MMKYMLLAVSLLAVISFHTSFAEAQECAPHAWRIQDAAAFASRSLKVHGRELAAYASKRRPGIDRANVVFLHGFADTAKNHRYLFHALSNANFRVLSFDYPEHGGSEKLSINTWSLNHLASVVPALLRDPGMDVDRSLPLVLVGWSTGGTIALKLGQERRLLGEDANRLKAVVGIAPGVPVRVDPRQILFNGGAIANEKLTRCPGGLADPRPGSTLHATGTFLTSLISESRKIEKTAMPADLPSLVLIAKLEDEFVLSQNAIDWALLRNGKNPALRALHCEEGFHGLEFEPGALGKEVRNNVVGFVTAAVTGRPFKPESNACDLLK